MRTLRPILGCCALVALLVLGVTALFGVAGYLIDQGEESEEGKELVSQTDSPPRR